MPSQINYKRDMYQDAMQQHPQHVIGLDPEHVIGLDPEKARKPAPAYVPLRKDIPLGTFLLEYFPDAFKELALLSKVANDQHNPGEHMHWARGKSNDHKDCLMRHFMDQGKIDTDGMRHTAKVAWRALAMLQLELEKARGAA